MNSNSSRLNESELNWMIHHVEMYESDETDMEEETNKRVTRGTDHDMSWKDVEWSEWSREKRKKKAKEKWK